VWALLLAARGACAQEDRGEQERAIGVIKKLGGKVGTEQQDPGRPVVTVDLNHTRATDDDLKLLKSLPRLRELAPALACRCG
jgi:hypothetical protein